MSRVEIIDNLWLGTCNSVKSGDIIMEIDAIFNLSAYDLYIEGLMQIYNIPVGRPMPNYEYKFTSLLNSMATCIDRHMQQGEQVLVVSNNLNGPAMVLVLYLICHADISLEDAKNIVSKKIRSIGEFVFFTEDLLGWINGAVPKTPGRPFHSV